LIKLFYINLNYSKSKLFGFVSNPIRSWFLPMALPWASILRPWTIRYASRRRD